MQTEIAGRKFKVRQTGEQFFYWSPRAVRWLPVSKAKVTFS